MAKTLKAIKEHFIDLISEVTIDGRTGEIEDDNSSRNKSLQQTPKNIKSPKQQPNLNQQKQLPPPEKKQLAPVSKAIANPSRIPVVVRTTSLPTAVEKKPEEKYMGKIQPEKKPELAKPEVKPTQEPQKKPEVKPTQTPEKKPSVDAQKTSTIAKPKAKPTPSVPLKTTKPTKKNDHIVKTGETPKETQRTSKDDSSLLKGILRGGSARVGARYSGPEHLIKPPTA